MKAGAVVSVAAIFLLLCYSSCNETSTPKPRGLFRIDFPEKKYSLFDTTCPFSFEYPVYAIINPADTGGYIRHLKSIDQRFEVSGEEISCWMNIEIPAYSVTIHCSYHRIHDNLHDFFEDSRNFAYKHTVRADAITERVIIRNEQRVYGILYEIEGNVASALQYYLTDSANHFFRGALYLNVPPNRDSLSPVIDFLKKDVYYMIESWKWKEIK